MLRFHLRQGTPGLFLFDGSPSTSGASLLRDLFPDSTIDDINRLAASFASRHGWAGQFAGHKLTAKLMALLHLQHSEPIFYIDSDVFIFRDADEIKEGIDSNSGLLLTDCGT